MSVSEKNVAGYESQFSVPTSAAGVRRPRAIITAAQLVRWTGLAAAAAGLIFAGIQPVHPPDVLASVTTPAWTAITTLKLAMCFLFLLGITGLYARQVEQSGRLGLAGFLVFSLSWALQTGFVFVEVLVLPVLAPAFPQFVESYLGIVNGQPGTLDLGALPLVYNLLVGIPYMLGGFLFGLALLRARMLPRWPAAIFALTALLTPLAALLPHAVQRMAAGMPMGLAFAWLGLALWADKGKNDEMRAGVARGQRPRPGGKKPTLIFHSETVQNLPGGLVPVPVEAREGRRNTRRSV